MAHEDFVNYEQAIQLKELGFDWACNHWYNYLKELKTTGDYFASNQGSFQGMPEHADAPTLYQAQKWLREVKGIAVCVQSFDSIRDKRYGKFYWKEYCLPNCDISGPQWEYWGIYSKYPVFMSYEEALSDGLNVMIKLLKGESPCQQY